MSILLLKLFYARKRSHIVLVSMLRLIITSTLPVCVDSLAGFLPRERYRIINNNNCIQTRALRARQTNPVALPALSFKVLSLFESACSLEYLLC